MRLYVYDRVIQQKVYLNLLASTRSELSNTIGSQWFTVNGRNFHVHNVVAETEVSATAAGAIIGGLIGLMAGPIGVLAGGLFGGAVGNTGDKTEVQRVNYFNHSRV
jgi:hypothetical protein